MNLINTTIVLSILACVSSYMIGIGLEGLKRPSRSSSLKLHLSGPKSPNEQMVDKVSSTSRVIAASAVVVAAQTLFPSVSGAYGDADELLRQKKNVGKPKKEEIVVSETDLGIKYRVSKKGTGPYPNPGDFVLFSYTALLSDGTVFDTTDAKGKKPLGFRMGQKQIIPGLESVIEMLQAGAEATCVIPPEYGYGKKGVCIKDGECLVPPNETLRYAIKIKTVGAGYN